ncbi:MAG: hypothetical protein OEN50_10815 [Deltaproteobacteria bacterium]|nr:hypothetical protein [Deltaproteobacteria bacterium]
MSYKDVREWIQKVNAMGELKVITGAAWNLEIGALAVLATKHKENGPALLERPAGPDHSEGAQRFQLPYDCRCLPSLRVARSIPACRVVQPGTATGFVSPVGKHSVRLKIFR